MIAYVVLECVQEQLLKQKNLEKKCGLCSRSQHSENPMQLRSVNSNLCAVKELAARKDVSLLLELARFGILVRSCVKWYTDMHCEVHNS